jgi:hypothetical protein
MKLKAFNQSTSSTTTIKKLGRSMGIPLTLTQFMNSLMYKKKEWVFHKIFSKNNRKSVLKFLLG